MLADWILGVRLVFHKLFMALVFYACNTTHMASPSCCWSRCFCCLFRTLVERIISARLVYRQPSMSRLVSFEYLNRQLVWQELSEFLLFLLPLINITKASLWCGGPRARAGQGECVDKSGG
jgi:hypothetical protein